MADENITLNIDMETKDAEKSLNRFRSIAQEAFSSSSTKVQDMGVKIDRVNGRLSNYISELKRLKNTTVPTEQYTKLQTRIDKVGKEYEKTKAKADKLADVRVPTERYQELTTRLSTTKSEVKSVETELSKMKETATFSALSKTAESYLNKLSKIESELAILRTSGKDATNSEDYIKLSQEADKYKRKISDACTALENLSAEGKRYENNREFEVKSARLKVLKTLIKSTEGEMQALENSDQAYEHSTAFTEQATKAKALETELNTLNAQKEKWDKEGTSGGGFTTQADLATSKVEKLKTAIQGCINQNEVNTNKVGETVQKEAELENKTGRVRKSTRDMGSAFTSVKTNVNSLLNTFKRFATTAINRVSKVASTLKNKLSGEITKTRNTSNTSFKSMLTQVLKYAFGIRSVFLLYKKIRTTIKTGIGEMAKDFEDVNESASELYNSWNTFKSSIISAFEPIYTYVVPALSTMLDYMTEVMNSLANFFANLTGASTYKKAIKQNNDYADSLSSTADSADEASEELATYDELLVITTDDSSDSTSSSQDTWQWVEVATTASEWAETIKDALTDWDFTEVGEKINNALVNAMSSINWDEVYGYASNFGTGLATFLNGLIDEDLFSTLGSTIAKSLNTAFTAVFTFADTFEWDELGDAIASGINSFVSDFDIKLAVNTFNKVANGILDTLIAAVNGVEWENVANAIADGIDTLDLSGIGSRLGKFVSGLANALYTLVSKKETWKNLGTKIGEGVNAFFTSMSEVDKKTGLNGWEALGQTISDTILGFGDTIITALETINWEEVGQGIADFISNIKWKDVVFKLGKLLNALKDAIIGIIAGLELTDEEVKGISIAIGAIAVTLLAISALKLGASITTAYLTNLISAKIGGIIPKAGVAITGVALIIGSIALSLVDTGNTFGNAVLDMFSALGVLVGLRMLKVPWSWSLVLAIGFLTISLLSDSAAFQEFKWQVKRKLGDLGLAEPMIEEGYTVTDDQKEGLTLYKEGKIELDFKKVDVKDSTSETSTAPLVSKVQSFIDKAMAQVNNESVLEVGGNLVKSVNTGAQNEIDSSENESFWSNAWSLFKTSVVGSLQSVFNMHSPSRVMMPYGQNILLGIVQGFKDKISSIGTYITNLKTTVVTYIESAFSSGWWSNIVSWFEGIIHWDDILNVFDENEWSEYWSGLWTDVEDTFSGVGQWFKDTFGGAWDNIKEAFSNTKTWSGEKWSDIKTPFSDTGTWFKEKFDGAWTNVSGAFSSTSEFFSGKWSDIKNAFPGDDGNGIKSWFSEKFGDAWDAVKSVFNGDGNGEGVSGFFNNLWSTIQDSFSSLGTNISDAIGDAVKEGLNSIIDFIEDTINDAIGIINSALDLVDKIIPGKTEKVDEVSLPKFARGGVATKATAGIFGEAGAEAIVPLENNIGWLDKMANMIADVAIPDITQGLVLPMSQEFIKATSGDSDYASKSLTVDDIVNAVSQAIDMNKSEDDHSPIVIALEGKQIAQVVWNESEKKYKQTGLRPAYT